MASLNARSIAGRPIIYMIESESETITAMALELEKRNPAVAELLFAELNRAELLSPSAKARRVQRFQQQTAAALRDIVIAMGLESPWQIRPHHLYERLNAVKSSSIDHIYPFLKDGALLDAPEKTPYAKFWAAARADSFRAEMGKRQTSYEEAA